MTEEKPFDVTIDRVGRIITIQGVKYAFGLFDHLGFGAVGSRFEIGRRRDGVVELRKLSSAK